MIAILLGGCATVWNPATGRNELILIDTQTEVSLGSKLDNQMQAELTMLNDPAKEARAWRIGRRVAASSDRQDLEYTFRVVNDRELNAFALPGGFIYVNKGLMDAANDDELAGVLGHELGHVAARHSVKNMQAALGYQLITSIVFGVNQNQTLSRAMGACFKVINLGYGRKDELLADKLAIRYSKKAGFDRNGVITLFEKLKAEEARRGMGSALEFLSSHPNIDERIKQAKELIAQDP